MKIILPVVFFLFLLGSAKGQNIDSLYDEAVEKYNQKKYEESVLLYEQLIKFRPVKTDAVWYYNLACDYALLGEKEKAFRALDLAVEMGWTDRAHAFTDEDLASLHAQPEWKVFVSRFNNLDRSKRVAYYWGIYFGILFVLFFYNLFLCLMLRSKAYLYYTLSVLLYAILELVNNKVFASLNENVVHGLQWLFWIKNPFVVFASCVVVMYLCFTRAFLKLEEKSKTLDRMIKISTCVLIAIALLGAFTLLPLREVGLIAWIWSYCLGLAAGIWCLIKKYRPARFFVLGGTFLSLGSIFICLRALDVTEYNFSFLVFNSYHVGATLFFLLLSFALGDQINILKKETVEAQQKALENLEEKVRERTAQVVKQKNEIEKQKLVVEEKQKEILDSIHYAKRIQTALLASEKYIERNLKKLNLKK